MTLELSVCVRDAYAVAAVRGELDITSSAGVMSAIAALTARHPVFGVHASADAFVAGIAGSPVAGASRRAERAGCSVARAAGAFRVIEVIANRALGASSDFPERARYRRVWTATVPGYADG